MAKRLTPEEIARTKRAKARKLRHDRKREELAAQIALDAASTAAEEGPVKPEKLGVAVSTVTAHKSPMTVKQAREQLTQAFEDMGGVPALVKWGKKFPTEFYRLWARLIPKDAPAAETSLPLETLLAKLSQRADMSIAAAAAEIGQEALDDAAQKVSIEDAMCAFARKEGESVQ